jgi:colanic acid biosynthesis glycosyl transferase WcaI
LTTTSSNPRLLFLNRSYYPDAEATGQLLTQLCEDLADEFDITVIAGQPNQNPQNIPFRRTGTEVHRGVAVRRVWNSRFPKRSFVGRATNLLSYLLTATLAGLTARRPDILIVETDPPLLCLLGALLRWRFRCQTVYYLQDIYPDLGVALGKLPDDAKIRWLRNRFFSAYQQADQVVVLSEDMRGVMIDADIPADRIEIIPNWIDTDHVVPVKENNAFRRELGLDDKFIVMYSGNLGLCQGLEHIISAADVLRDHDDVAFVFVGDGASKAGLMDRASELSLPNVRFLDYRPASELSTSLSAADLHLVPIDPRVIRYLMPSKLYGVLASGTPVLTVAPPDSELARLVEEQQVGRNVEPNDPASLAAKILEFLEIRNTSTTDSTSTDSWALYGERARELAVTHYDRRVSIQTFRDMLHRLRQEAYLRLTRSRRRGPPHTPQPPAISCTR